MKSTIISVTPIFLILMIVVVMAAHADSTAQSDHQALADEVQEMLRASMELHQRNDHEGMARRFTPDGYLKLPGQPMISGHEALSRHYATVLKSDIISFDSSIVTQEFSQSGDVGILIMEFQATFSGADGPVDSSGVILMVLKKVEGAWKIFAESVSAGPVNTGLVT